MKRRALKKFLVPATLTLGLFVYVGSYLWRSTRGRYEPAAIGLNGVKWYSWAPSAYVTDFRWNQTLMLVYCPLYFLDTRFWHTSDEAYGSRYPINQVPTTHGLGISAFAADWPQFRGPTGQGLTDEKALPLEWGGKEKRNVRWQVPLRGQGHASPIVSGDAIFVCTVEWPSNSGPREKSMPAHHVARYRTTDGQLIWDTQVPAGPWLRTDFRSGPGGGYAAPTPATDGRRVFCLFGSSVLAALDFDGKMIWRKEIVPHTFDVTVGSSPVLFRDTVLVFCAMAKASDSCLIAFDQATGEEKWRAKFPDMAFGHSTPLRIEVNGLPQLVVLASGMGVKSNALRSLDPATGKTLWWCRGAGDASSPAYGSGVVYFDSGRGSAGVAVSPEGAGDVTETGVRWTIPQVPEAIGSPIIVAGYLYRLNSPAVLKCFETATGKLVYAERLEGISTTWAGPIADAAGHLFFANAGKSYVLQTGPEFRVLAVNDLGDGNHASPAVADGCLFLVGARQLHCIGRKH